MANKETFRINEVLERGERERNREIERKLVPYDPAEFDHYKESAVPIEQVYLSTPGEECSLRVREVATPEGLRYSATLKAERHASEQGVDRLEIETDALTPEAYRYFAANLALPRVKKLRATMQPGITIDWIEGIESPLIEIERHELTEESRNLAQLIEHRSMDVSDEPSWDNAEIAYQLYDMEARETSELDPREIADGMVADLRTGRKVAIATISGMSGSGKSTIARQVAETLRGRYPDLPAPLVLSTDDYHVGKTYLEQTYGSPWTNWDAAEVYDTARLASDLEALRNGAETIQLRHFDFATQEPALDDEAPASPFVIVEGVRAASDDLEGIRTRHYQLPTPLATCLLRDVRRVHQRPSASIGTAEQRLAYVLNVAVPEYERQVQPVRERFSASARPMGSTALEWLRHPQ